MLSVMTPSQMSGDHLLARQVGQELEDRTIALAVGRIDGSQAQLGQRVEQAALGRFDAIPALMVLGQRQIRQHPGLPAGNAQRVGIGGRNREIAGLVLEVIAAQPVMADLAFTAPARLALPKALVVARHGFDRAQREPVRQEGQRAAALEALHVLEEQRVAAVVAAKSPHCLQLLQTEKAGAPSPVACLFTPADGPAPLGSGTNHQVVLHALHALGGASQLFRLGFLGAALGEARQHHRAIERLHRDGAGVDGLVFDELGLDGGGDRCVIDIGARRFLAAQRLRSRWR